MRVAYIFLTYQEPDNVFKKLLGHLRSDPEAIICIHHDFNQSDFPADLIDKYHLVLLPNYYQTYWSHINNVKASYDAIKYVFSNFKVDWFIFITPTCYPVKKLKDIYSFYEATKFDAFLDQRQVCIESPSEGLDTYLVQHLKRRKLFSIPFLTKKMKFYFRPIFTNRDEIPFDESFNFFHGSNHVSFNRHAARTIIESHEYSKLVTFFEQKVGGVDQHPCPQEIVFQSILGNSNNVKIYNSNYRYIDWTDAKNWSPNWLNESHFHKFIHLDFHFARKFHAQKSIKLLEMIDEIL